MAITDLLYTPINSLKMVLSPFLDLASDIFNFIEAIKTSFQSLRKRYVSCVTSVCDRCAIGCLYIAHGFASVKMTQNNDEKTHVSSEV